jgi:hypothetical protein
MKARVKSTQKRCKNDIKGAKMTQKVQQTVRKGPNLGEQKPSRGRQEERRKREREREKKKEKMRKRLPEEKTPVDGCKILRQLVDGKHPILIPLWSGCVS